jgi:hypothetical protein
MPALLADAYGFDEHEPFAPMPAEVVMAGSLLFVHGTGVKDISRTLKFLRDGLCKRLDIPASRIVGVEWGMAVAPAALNVEPSLPPTSTKGLVDGTPDDEGTEDDIWELLVADPLVELRLLATREGGDDADQGIVVGDLPAGEELQSRLEELGVEAGSLAGAEITESQLAEAAGKVADSEELGEAATGAGDAGYQELLHATARSVVAFLLSECRDSSPDGMPRVCIDATVRDELVKEVLASLESGIPKGLLSRAAKAVLLPLATKAAVRKREDFMAGTADFLRDVAFYMRRGETIRKEVRKWLAKQSHDEPVVLLGHSLGGIAAVDLLADQKRTERVDLLVTVGSQAPLLYLMDALVHLRPGVSKVEPFTPWLNVYDRNDLLSFCAERVWPNTTGIVDQQVESRLPFPTSHSAYWSLETLYETVAKHWPKTTS